MTSIRMVALAACALVAACGAASAQAWPSRPVTVMVPFPAGGTADLLARGIAQALSDELHQPFVLENRPGASGNLAAAAVAKAPPDGNNLLFASQAQAAFNKLMFATLPYDPQRDLLPIVLVAKAPVAFVAGKGAPVQSLREMVDQAKANPGKLTVGQLGVGSMSHIAYELLRQKTGITLNGVPYKGGALMVTDLLGGHLPLASDLLSNYIQLAKEKKVRVLAVATAERISDLPDVPTVQELIQAPVEAAAWFALMARAGTPADIVQRVSAIANRYLHSAQAKGLIERHALLVGGGTPADAATFVKLELDKWAPVIKTANISLD